MAVGPQRGRWPKGHAVAAKLLLLFGGIAMALIAAELTFRTYDALFQGLPFWWDPAAASKKRTQLCNPFLLFRGTNQDWTRRAKNPSQVIHPGGRERIRIICLGGSTTQNATAMGEDGITYPTELQRLLNNALPPASGVVVETINAGFPAHSSLHSLILLQTELLALDPDLVIVYHNINDLTVNYFPGPTTPIYANKFLHRFYLPPEMTVEKATWLDHSRLYTWSRDRLRTVFWYDVVYADSPIELIHADSFRTNLENIVAVAQAHGVAVMFGEQAMAADDTLFRRQYKTKSYNDVVRYPRLTEFERHFVSYNQIVREVANRHGLPCASPYRVLKGKHEMFADVVHVHASGARAMAREFARELIDSGLFEDLLWRRHRRVAARP